MASSLVIVESPAKARTISRFLGDDYVVESSVGHIRDLPRNASEVPAAFKSEQWATLGVNPDAGFKPLYVVTAKDQVRRLKSLLRNADELYLATDEDREGEAIAWHLLEVLNPQIPVRRMVFHEITAAAIREAIDNPRDLDRRLVDAQEARRIFDRLYGYEVSPVLWRKVAPKLSAGRVQSVANRLIVERERERMAFRAAEYWSLVATLDAAAEPTGAARPGQFDASLASLNGRRIATGRDFDQQGELRTDGVAVLDSDAAAALADDLDGARLAVVSRESKPYRRRPPAPFITSTLQQAAGARLGFSASRTMAAAQRLYENGRITYMRTDSTTLSDQALGAARRIVAARFGAENLPPKPRIYTRKVKNAQEAHEAVRPAGENWPEPGGVTDLGGDAARLYDLIWQRTIASQMIDATGETVTIRLAGTANCGLAPELAGGAGAPGPHDVEFSAAGTVVTSPGFRLVYVPAAAGTDEEPERILPDIDAGDEATAVALEASEHSTSPPARFTEASLIRRLEELGVGRPSTYASIIETIQARGYAWKKGSALVPALVAFATVGLMERHFDHLVDYALTARMESDLDEIANGDRDAEPWLTAFYFGNKDASTPEAAGGLRYLVSDDRLADIDPAEINGPGGALRPVPAARRRHPPAARRPRTRRAHLGPGARAAGRAHRTGAGHRSRHRPRRDRAPRPFRPLRLGRPARRDPRASPYRLAALWPDARNRHAGRCAAIADAAAHCRRRPRRRRGDHRAERALRSLSHQGACGRCEGREPQPRVGGPALHAHLGRGAGVARSAPTPPRPAGGERGPRDRSGPRERQADGAAGRPVRAVRDRRRVQRVAAPGR